jgi:hypothetical protein
VRYVPPHLVQATKGNGALIRNFTWPHYTIKNVSFDKISARKRFYRYVYHYFKAGNIPLRADKSKVSRADEFAVLFYRKASFCNAKDNRHNIYRKT